MGSGKTTLGRGLASALGREFHDSDLSIRSRTGQTGREIAERDGVTALHEMEKQALLDSLSRPEPVVVAAAASTIEHAEVRRALDGAYCIWVTAEPEILAERSAWGSHRREVSPSEHLERRDRLYARAADLVIDTGDLSAGEAVEAAMAALGVTGSS